MPLVAVVSWLALAAGPDAPDAASIARLIRQLGSPEFAEREAATRRLEAVGEPALEALRQAGASEDPEVRRRARELVEVIAARDYRKLEGTWECVPDGSPRLVIKDGQAVFERGTRVSLRFVLAPRQEPKTIDFVRDGRLVLAGLYALEGDELRVCLSVRNDRQRPRAFARAGDPDAVTLRFRRAGPARGTKAGPGEAPR
jgi:uncharacterized protein (TIGR03067 family)